MDEDDFVDDDDAIEIDLHRKSSEISSRELSQIWIIPIVSKNQLTWKVWRIMVED